MGHKATLILVRVHRIILHFDDIFSRLLMPLIERFLQQNNLQRGPLRMNGSAKGTVVMDAHTKGALCIDG
jgi:hypothetical protein